MDLGESSPVMVPTFSSVNEAASGRGTVVVVGLVVVAVVVGVGIGIVVEVVAGTAVVVIGTVVEVGAGSSARVTVQAPSSSNPAIRQASERGRMVRAA